MYIDSKYRRYYLTSISCLLSLLVCVVSDHMDMHHVWTKWDYHVFCLLVDDVNTASLSPWTPFTTNLMYLRNYGFYTKFAYAIVVIGILIDLSNVWVAMNLALELIHPKLAQSPEGKRSSSNSDSNNLGENIICIRNTDATQLVIGLTTQLPDTDTYKPLVKNMLGKLLRLCANGIAGLSLARLASSALYSSITSQNNSAHMLEDRLHFLYSWSLLLLRHIGMTYNNCVCLL